MSTESETAAVVSSLERFVLSFDFNRPGRDRSLGRDCVGIIAMGIQRRSIQGRKPDGSPFNPNSPKWAEYKMRRFGVTNVGVLTGQMFSQESLEGEPEITRNSVTMKYGTGTPSAGHNSTSGGASTSTVTDRQKASYFADSGNDFYESDEEIDALVANEYSEYVDREVNRLMGSL
jgi:hypothetical protein